MASTAGKKTSRFFVWALLILLIAGLAGFGSSGLGGALTKIGSVGSTTLDLQDYARNLQREIQFEQRRLQRPITSQEIRQGGIEARVRGTMIAEAALSEEAKTMGLSIGDDELARQLQLDPSFHGPDGRFDRNTYELALRQIQTSPSDFETDLRATTARAMLQQAAIGGLEVNQTYAETLYGFIAEERAFEWVLMDEAQLDAPVPEPAETDLAAFHTDNAEMFETPEMQRVSYVWLSPDMLLEQIEVDDADLRALYAEREATFNLPERRIAERLSFPDLETAAAAKARIEAGETTFEALVEERGLSLEDVDQGELSRDDLAPEIADAVFALTEPGLSEPVETSLGPALYRINAVLEAQSTSFEEVRDELLSETTTDRARRMITDQTEQIDDLLVGGATLEEVAQDTDMQLGTVDYHAGVSDGLAAYEEFRSVVPVLTSDDFPEIATLRDGGIFAVRLDEIVAPVLPDLDEVREAVTDAWRADQLRQMLEAKAETLIAELDAGKSMTELGLTPNTNEGQPRTGFVEGAPTGMLVALFEMAEGETRVVSDAGRTALVQLTQIAPVDTSTEDAQALLERINEQASQTLASDVFQIFGSAVQSRHDVSIDAVAIDQVIRQLTGEGYGG